MRGWLAVVVALWLCAPMAEACPRGSPCLKYRTRHETIYEPPNYYQRDVQAAIPKFDRKKLTRFLVGSRWTPIYGSPFPGGPEPAPDPNPGGRVVYEHKRESRKFRFVDPTSAIPTAKPNERIVLIREIERDDKGNIYVNVDGTAFQLTRCVAKTRAVCLVQGGDFASMFPLPPAAGSNVGSGFATPPP